jgi:hypothetical protein
MTRAFGAFWWDFLVGDDWRTTLGVLLALLATVLVHQLGVNAWWIVPLTVVAVLVDSLRRATKRSV